MAGTQLLRLQVNERLAAAAEEIFGLVEKTIAEYQDEVVRSRTEIIQLRKQLEQLTVLKPEVMLFRAEIQLVSEEILPSQQPDQLPTVVKTEPLDSQQVQDVSIFQIPLVQVDTVPPLCPSDTKPDSKDLLLLLQECDIKAEPIQEYPQVKEEQVDQCISPDVEADTSNNAAVRLSKSEPTSDFDFFPSSTAVTVGVNESIDDKQSDGSSMLCCDSKEDQSQSVEVHMELELEQPQRDKKSCRFCSDTVRSDRALRRHMQRYHEGQKAFKCLECNKEFDQRHHLIQHVRIHTGEKPFGCNYCEKSYAQKSSRTVHMRLHTGEKPYHCAKCGKSFASSSHFRFCKMKKETKKETKKSATSAKSKTKSFHCTTCGKFFYTETDLNLHMQVHESWKRHMSEKLKNYSVRRKNKLCDTKYLGKTSI